MSHAHSLWLTGSMGTKIAALPAILNGKKQIWRRGRRRKQLRPSTARGEEVDWERDAHNGLIRHRVGAGRWGHQGSGHPGSR